MKRTVFILALLTAVPAISCFLSAPWRSQRSHSQRSIPQSSQGTSPLGHRYTIGQLTRVSDSVPTGSAGQGNSVTPTLVGRQTCRECHAENFSLHANHGHASTFHSVSQTELAETFSGTSFDAGEPYGTYEYDADDQGNLSVRLPSQFGDQPFPLQYALGSGHSAQTMLTLAPTPDGGTEGIEHRVTCYAGQRLGLTPGHSKKQPRSALEFFGDSSSGEPLGRCIYCHTTSANINQAQIDQLIPNVNCEKCHGPGSEHVRLARLSPTPPPFSVGHSDWDTELEIQLCGDCHRMPRSVTEKEIREYPDLLVRFQPIGLLRSACYLESNRELGCTDCHNPHASVHTSGEAERQVEKCVDCHQSSQHDHVACPVSPQEGCIECHMPAIKLSTGLQFHDHWIRVREDPVAVQHAATD